MEKFSPLEHRAIEAIRSGKSRSDILAENIIKANCLPKVLTDIYSKTNKVVKYHTARNKFEELTCYLRNNPDAFAATPFEEEQEEVMVKEVVEKIVNDIVIDENEVILKVKKAFDKVSTKLKAKLEVLDEVFTEIAKELEG